VADGGGLENRYRETYRGFESLALRPVRRLRGPELLGCVAVAPVSALTVDDRQKPWFSVARGTRGARQFS
jgi:hypothetical protein